MRDRLRRHRTALIVAGAAVATLAAAAIVVAVLVARDVHHRITVQAIDDPAVLAFYTPPADWPGAAPGTLLRAAPLAGAPPGSRGWRVLYRTQGARGEPRVASGMVFAPDGAPPAGGRDVVAWAHGTVGMGRACTPSLGRNPIADMPWLPLMLRRGWVVTATDYAGLGTPGTPGYLVGASEAHDVLNSVRALKGLPAAGAGDRYALWGHSQGGHAAYSAAEIAARYLPGERLVGAAAAAPATDLVGQFGAQWRRPVSWVIGSEVLVAWPSVYPDARPALVTTDIGRKVYASEARRCVAAGALSGTIRSRLGQRLFRVDPMSDAAFRRIGAQNTPNRLPTAVPVFLAQGLEDQVVLPGQQARFVVGQCRRGVNITQLWLAQTGHLTAAHVAGPTVTAWLAARFAGTPAHGDCGVPPPIPAAAG